MISFEADDNEARRLVAKMDAGQRVLVIGKLLSQVSAPIRALSAFSPCKCGVGDCLENGIAEAAGKFVSEMVRLLGDA